MCPIYAVAFRAEAEKNQHMLSLFPPCFCSVTFGRKLFISKPYIYSYEKLEVFILLLTLLIMCLGVKD